MLTRPGDASSAGQGNARGWHARAVGGAATDLDIRFVGADRASTVTAVLTACVTDPQGRPVSVDEAWSWTLNQRLQALIAVRLAAGDSLLELQAPCTRCGEAMGLELDLQAFAAAPAAPRFSWRGADGVELALRLPNGRDLQAWRAALHEESMQHQAGAMSEALAVSLIEGVAGQPFDAEQHSLATLLPALDDAFEAHDPLTALRLETSCPACSYANRVACDLEALLLDGFAREQASLLNEVLQLASAFHWSEAEILALPRWRRAHYLRQLEAGVSA